MEKKEHKGVLHHVEEVRQLETSPRLDPYQSRVLLDELSKEERQNLWGRVIKRCIDETSFFEEYNEASLLGWIRGETDIDFPVQFNVPGELDSGFYSKRKGIEVYSSAPTAKEFLLSLASYGSLPVKIQTLNHEIIHAMQLNPAGNKNLLRRLKSIGDTISRLQFGLPFREERELMEVHAYKATHLRGISLGESIKRIDRRMGVWRNFNKIIDAALIVERSRAIGLKDQEIVQAMRRNYSWEEPSDQRDISWIIDLEHPRYEEIEKLARTKKWPAEWAEEYTYAAETGGCFLDLREWLINKCVDKGISPDDLEIKLFESKLQQRREELRAAFICQEEIVSTIKHNYPDVEDRLTTPSRDRFVLDSRNLIERPAPVKVKKKREEIIRRMEEDYSQLELVLENLLVVQDLREMDSGVTFDDPFSNLKPKDKIVKNSSVFLSEIQKMVKNRGIDHFSGRYVKAVIDNLQALAESGREEVINSLLSIIEGQYAKIVQESMLDYKLDKNPARIAGLLAECYRKRGDLSKARDWYVRSYNWYEEALHNPMTLHFDGMSMKSMVSAKENVLEDLEMLESKI